MGAMSQIELLPHLPHHPLVYVYPLPLPLPLPLSLSLSLSLWLSLLRVAYPWHRFVSLPTHHSLQHLSLSLSHSLSLAQTPTPILDGTTSQRVDKLCLDCGHQREPCTRYLPLH